MKTFKKVLGVVLAIAMLAGVFSMMASALAPDSAVDYHLSVDKASYSAGDEVVLTVAVQADPAVGNITIEGQHGIGYNSAYINPISKTTDSLNDEGFVALADGYLPDVSGVSQNANNVAEGDTLEDDAVANGWNETIMYIVGSTGAEIDASSETALFSVKFKIADDCPDGEYVIGTNKGSYMSYHGYINAVDLGMGIYGYDDDYGYGTTANYGMGTVTIKVGAAGPVVTYEKTQLKLNAGGYDVQMRITSKITDSDFDTYFPNTTIHGTDPAPTAHALTSVGIVAFDGAQADFDEAAAKALVIDGTAADGYKTAETDYISKADDSADGYFGAILRGSRAAFENKPVTFLGFAKYLDADGNAQVIFYEAAVEKTITTSYFGS